MNLPNATVTIPRVIRQLKLGEKNGTAGTRMNCC